MLESSIEKSFLRKVKALGAITYKMASQYTSGWPDRLVVLPNGKCVFIEFKTPKGKLTPRQEFQIERLRSMNQQVYVARSADEALAYCQENI